MFCVTTYYQVQLNHRIHIHPTKYFYWSGTRLDTDPLNRNQHLIRPCEDSDPACIEWDLLEMHSDPGWMVRYLVLTGFPAFLAAAAPIYVLAKLGASQLTTFMVSMPILLFAWYYFLGSLLDAAILKRIRERLPRRISHGKTRAE